VNDRPLNVLYFSNETVRGGVEEHMLSLIRALNRTYFRPHLVCAPELVSKISADLSPDVEVIPLHFERPTQVARAYRFARILRRHRIDIIHSHLFRSSLVASPIGWLCRVPVILETPHIREVWRQGWLKGSFVIDRLAGHFVDGYIAVSESNRQYLSNTKGLPLSRIEVIQNGCDLTRFEPDRLPSADLKKSLGFAPDDPVIVVLARLESQKGHRILIDALTLICREFPSARLVCVGDGSLRDLLEEQVRRASLDNAVRFVGYQSNVPDWLALSDLVVLPSFFEGLPLVAIESLAAGRAVVASNVDGTPEVVIHEETGLTVPPGDPVALASAICRLLRQPELRKRLAEKGREWVIEKFSADRFIERTQQFYLGTWDEYRRKYPDRRPVATSMPERPSSV